MKDGYLVTIFYDNILLSKVLGRAMCVLVQQIALFLILEHYLAQLKKK